MRAGEGGEGKKPTPARNASLPLGLPSLHIRSNSANPLTSVARALSAASDSCPLKASRRTPSLSMTSSLADTNDATFSLARVLSCFSSLRDAKGVRAQTSVKRMLLSPKAYLYMFYTVLVYAPYIFFVGVSILICSPRREKCDCCSSLPLSSAHAHLFSCCECLSMYEFKTVSSLFAHRFSHCLRTSMHEFTTSPSWAGVHTSPPR